MKAFFNKYSYSIVKMFVDQFAISIFGAVLAMATASTGNDTLSLIVGFFAILFYLYLIYTMTWEIGAKDKISVDVGKQEYRPLNGLYMALVANIPNFIIAILYTIAYPMMGSMAWAGNTAAILRLCSVIIQGMYLGVTSSITVGGTQLNQLWWTYFIIIIPSLVTTFAAYYLGHRNFRFLSAITKRDNNGKSVR